MAISARNAFDNERDLILTHRSAMWRPHHLALQILGVTGACVPFIERPERLSLIAPRLDVSRSKFLRRQSPDLAQIAGNTYCRVLAFVYNSCKELRMCVGTTLFFATALVADAVATSGTTARIR